MNQNYNNNEYEIKDTDTMGYQSRYPLANTPGAELQQMNYKEWMDRCTNGESIDVFGDTAGAVRNTLIIGTGVAWALLGLIPVVGGPASAIAGLFNVLLPYWWPEQAGPPGTPQAQYTWKQLMAGAEDITNKKIQESAKSYATAQWQRVQTYQADFTQARCDWIQDRNNEIKKSRLQDAFDDFNDELQGSMPFFRVQGFEVQMLSMYAQAANMHLLLLRDVVQNGLSWGFLQSEVDRYYLNPQGNQGLLQLLGTYTNYCIDWYNKGLQEQYATGDWNKFNNFRTTMTIAVLDTVSVWPTFDPRQYALPTKSQLTRMVYTPRVGDTARSYRPSQPINAQENSIVSIPRLFAWLREVEASTPRETPGSSYSMIWYKQTFQNTLGGSQWSISKGTTSADDVRTMLTIPSPQFQDDVLKIKNRFYNYLGPFDDYTVDKWTFSLTHSADQNFEMNPYASDITRLYGLPCRGQDSGICEPCDEEHPCINEPPNTTMPCEDKQLYSHRLSYIGAGENTYSKNNLTYFGYGWTHVSADAHNLVDVKKITQIPAVKGSSISGDARVIKGSGSTGGDLIKLSTGGSVTVKVTMPISVSKQTQWYQIRMRYANDETNLLRLVVKSDFEEWSRVQQLPGTYLGEELIFQSFAYRNLVDGIATYEEKYILELTLENLGNPNDIDINTNLLIDKIEFIPIEGSVGEYKANQAVEEARKVVNALFTGAAKNALKLNVTDYAVDQASNLVECVSDEFHAQEKMILLDQVKFAKRLSQTRNLLHYGDFESSNWSGENGWKTSHHVHVTANNPIFKGRYLHMPGVTSSPFSNTVYPTYVYQKVDESKLKSYTRYLVRGFVGNSKDLELLVERYGKDVHVEMDVPDDIRYTLPMNECGGFDRCKSASDQTRTP
ncbi:insecticidal delta-endotoxin Cry8Ea1 family protein, partial [Bacillus toyonensis]|uniref:insecticidal delta-endotoxin Cry8Ea1 family protein n=1 Tax=Bacillus toyonensis TaxID=155322 RepID=UPI002FFD7F8F